MPFPIIDEDTVLDSFSTTNNGSRPLGHNIIYGSSSDDTPSILSHSTNSTASNLPGPGRVLGNFYSSTGRRLERTLADLAHKAGFGPEAIYQQISSLYLENWKTDGKKASKLQNLCFKLFEHSSSVVESNRFRAIRRWGDILRNQHEIYVWLVCSQRERMVKYASALFRVIEEHRSTSNTLSDLQDDVLSETSLLIDFHSVSLNVININHARLLFGEGNFHLDWTGVTDIHREEAEKWDLFLQYLLKSLSDPTISELSRWYIGFWTSKICNENMHTSFAHQSCLTLHSVLKAVDPSHADRWDTLAILGKNLHEYFVGRSHSRTLLIAQCNDFVLCDGVPVHISTILNDLVRSYNRVFSPGLDIVPDLTCITMLGSTDLISADVKEKIRGFLKDLQDFNKVKDKPFTKSMLLRSCYRLLRRALSELQETDCFDKLSNVTSFTDGTSRWAILQLGDILQSLPEVYMLLITLGGDEMRDCVQTLRQSLDVSDNSTSTLASERYPMVTMNLRSLLACHAAGLWLASDDMSYGLPLKVQEFIARTTPLNNNNFHEARDHLVPYLMDNVTLNPLIFYLKYCASRSWRASYLWYYRQSFLSCSIVQGALLTGWSVPQEDRSTMEELCRSMQNSVIEQLRSCVGHNGITITNIGNAMRSVYTDLTQSSQAFEDEAEVYLSQLCNLLFEMINFQYMWWDERGAVTELSHLFQCRNFFGWFLSIRGPGAEESISKFLDSIDNSQITYPKDVWYYKRPFSHLEAHKLGVELLAPRHEKLHFEGTGLTKHFSTRSAEPPLTAEQRERWINAFKTLAANLSSADSDLMDISLFYFANCPLPYEADLILDTTIALDYCEDVLFVLSERRLFDSANKEDLSRAVSHIYTCLTKRVQEPWWNDLAPDDYPTFYGIPVNIHKVVKALDNLVKLSLEKIRFRIPTTDGHVFC